MTHMMSETTVAKIPVLSEKSALSIFGRVLSGDIKVCIGEIVYTDPVHRARLGFAHLGFARRAAYCTPSGAEVDIMQSRSISTLVSPPMHS